MKITPELLRKYNVQGPRYTSYPPAPSWRDDVGLEAYSSALEASARSSAPLSIYVHLPFCEQLCRFCGCTTLIVGRNRRFEDPYLAALKREIDWVADRLGGNRRVVQFHFGGGTPTFHDPSVLVDIASRIRDRFPFDRAAEVGIEVDPRTTTPAHLSALREMGFNRVSMGVQDFDPDVQAAVNRLQSFACTRDVVETARRLGYGSVNMDLIYGLPRQSVASFRRTIDDVLALSPDRLAVYSYAHVPWLKKHQAPLEPFLPPDEEKYEIFLLALERFRESGYHYVGMDHFAKHDDELAAAQRDGTLWRNFMGYTTKAGTDLIGLGMSAIGNVAGGFYQNARDVAAYQQSVNAAGGATRRGFVLSDEDRLRSRVIQGLLCHATLVKKDIEDEFGIDFDRHFADALERLKEPAADGLVVIDGGRIQPTPAGRVFLRNLAMPFDAYFPATGEGRLFSRTV